MNSAYLKITEKYRFLFTSFFTGVAGILVLYLTPLTYAAETLFPNPIEYETLDQLLLALVDGVVTILIPIVALGIVYIGFKMVLSAGSKPEEFLKWRMSLLYALIGLFLVLGAKGILGVIKTTVQDVLREPTSAAIRSPHEVI